MPVSGTRSSGVALRTFKRPLVLENRERFKQVRAGDRTGSVLVHGLAVGAQRVALVEPFAGGADGVAAACCGQLDQAGALLAGAAVDLAARGRRRGPAGRGWHWHLG